MRIVLLASLVLLLSGFTCREEPEGPLQLRRVRFEGAELIVAEADPRRVRLRMLSGVRSLADAEAALRRRGERTLLLTNGGLFHDGAPIGLHVEDGRVVRGLRLGSTPAPGQSPGNFYYLPNAVLFQDRQGRVAIRESGAMRGRESEVRDGLQSGPALLLNGRVHRVATAANRGVAHERRVAACITVRGRLAIVFAPGATTFPQLTRALVAEAGCRDAVFLDANVTGLLVPDGGIHIRARETAGVLALTVAADRAVR